MEESLLEFPCEFPIKVVGRSSDDFATHVLTLIEPIVGLLENDTVKHQPSRNGNFVSLTISFVAQNQTQLNRVYETLSASPDVLFTL